MPTRVTLRNGIAYELNIPLVEMKNSLADKDGFHQYGRRNGSSVLINHEAIDSVEERENDE